MTASSIKEIDALIKANVSEMDDGMSNMLQSMDLTGRIIEGVNSIARMMNVVSESIRKQVEANATAGGETQNVMNRAEEIKNAMDEQKLAVTEIVRSISNINQLTQASASGAEEMAGNSETIAAYAESLKQMSDSFTV